MRGIDHLKAQGIRVLISFTVMQQNYKDMKRLAAVCAAHHVDKLWWDRVVTGDATQYLNGAIPGSIEVCGKTGRKVFLSQ